MDQMGVAVRDPIENINILQKQINELQLENQTLKNILDRCHISYTRELKQITYSLPIFGGGMIFTQKDL